ncbi:uncharacterized protein (TIGR00255 family) [Bacillus oleivorans]|uniref:Uncharacterized protein (TIGR00255 family) n=1 Tax=Bacillus oleivorans TaxID=1448271 RepID=A0A285D1H7_9BACI|nr:YicC/YloC family endoribonuclease [Bacillus oleivorans]SNX73525.1 uncharacterized protein (TIGR00255 family) [Bacillus oleivorans]
MIKSMTGFGSSTKESESFQVTVELKAVNHRFCEINLRIPRSFLHIEDQMKKRIQGFIHRGRIEGFINIEGEGLIAKTLKVDWTLLDQYVHALHQVKNQYSIPEEVSLSHVLKQEGILQLQETEDHSLKEVEEMLLLCADEAAQALLSMRRREGGELKKVLIQYIDELKRSFKNLEQLAPKVVQHYKERLEKKVKELYTGPVDENRLLQEVVIFSDKADISEEITRLMSHCGQFLQSLELNEPVGRKLDFLIQEMNREVNTIGSKANDQQIAQNVVELKSILEKMREQVQNIE